jgi:hypothetical protein
LVPWVVGAALGLAVLPSAAGAQGFGMARTRVVAGRGGVAVSTVRAGAAVGPLGGVHAGVARTTSVVGPGGAFVHTSRVAAVPAVPRVGIGGFGMVTPAVRPFPAAPCGGMAVGPLGGVRAVGVSSAVRAPLGGVAAVGMGGIPFGHVTRFYSPTLLQTQAVYVRRSFATPAFTAAWFGAHRVPWAPPRWRVANFWAAPAWGSLAAYCGISTPPFLYDYGSNIVINNNLVYVNGQPVCTAAEFADQAYGLADRGRGAVAAADLAWQPLGVFGLLAGADEQPQRIFQLGVDPTGIVRGNCYDVVTDSAVPVYGSVDLRTQRLAWSVGDRRTVVFETGLSNLTQDQTTVLVHYGNDRTEQMALVRLEEPPPGR